MVSSTLILATALTASATGWAQYTLQQDFMEGGNFLDQFTFWDQGDPTNGFVQYLSQSDAQMAGLITQSNNQITLASDSKETTTTGRKSIRITSNLSFQTGLVILDLAHMPGSICGSWPAFWTVGPNWPNQGEIDIIEGVNTNTFNAMTLHTGAGCSINNSGFSGTLSTPNCDIDASGQPTNAGCSIDATSSNTYGDGFNSAGGGVYAMELTSNGISIYFFSRGNIPSDVNSDSPDPSGWGEPLSSFQGDCDFAQKFTNQQIVFDNTFCGDWAGAVWPTSSCAAQYGGSCENFVGQNPSAFAESYWTINSLKLFSGNGQVGGGSGNSTNSQPAGSGSGPQTTFSTSQATWGWGGSAPASPAPSPGPSPSGGAPPFHGHRHHHHHGGFPPGNSSPTGAPPSTPPVASSPAQTSPPAAGSSAPAQSPPAGVSFPVSPQPPAASPPSAPAAIPPSQPTSAPAALSSPVASPSQSDNGGSGSSAQPPQYSGGQPPQYSGRQGNVEAMTYSVSQPVVAGTQNASPAVASSTSTAGALAVEHSQGAGVYGVGNGVVGRRDPERHLRSHVHKARRAGLRR